MCLTLQQKTIRRAGDTIKTTLLDMITFTKDFETIATASKSLFENFDNMQDYIIDMVNKFKCSGFVTFNGKNVLQFVYSEFASENICFLFESKRELNKLIKSF